MDTNRFNPCIVITAFILGPEQYRPAITIA
jgi:hypothetical protein